MTALTALERLTTLYPKTIDLSLDRIRRILADLGNPQHRLPPVLHVAGTNGKGSTVAYLRAALEAAGKRVHVYTSPHLVRFNERIRLAGALIEDAPLEALLVEVEQINAGRPITFFEATTAAAFLAFSRVHADATLLEVGMGGRLDATNLVARPLACAITQISFDHTEYLGTTLAQIAGEKACILKPGVPAAIGVQPEEAAPVFDEFAQRLGAPLFRFGREWRVAETASGFRYEGRSTLDLPPPSLPGRHQIFNAGLALATLDCAPSLGLAEAHRARGIAAAEWPARLQRLTRGALAKLLPPGTRLFLDGGHNENAGEALADWARTEARPLDLVFGMRSNKAAPAFFAHLAPHVRRLRAVHIPGDYLSTDPARAAEIARNAGIADAAPAPSVAVAIAELVAAPDPPPLILICGSLYLAGHVLADNC